MLLYGNAWEYMALCLPRWLDSADHPGANKNSNSAEFKNQQSCKALRRISTWSKRGSNTGFGIWLSHFLVHDSTLKAAPGALRIGYNLQKRWLLDVAASEVTTDATFRRLLGFYCHPSIRNTFHSWGTRALLGEHPLATGKWLGTMCFWCKPSFLRSCFYQKWSLFQFCKRTFCMVQNVGIQNAHILQKATDTRQSVAAIISFELWEGILTNT